MPPASKFLIPGVCFLVGVGTAYFAAPSKVVTKTEVREKIVTVVEKEKHANVVVTKEETDRPDGTKVITTVTVDKTVEKEADRTKETVVATETKTVERQSPQWNLRAMAGFDLKARTPSYGAGLERRLLGPIFIGVYGFSSGAAGVSVALFF